MAKKKCGICKNPPPALSGLDTCSHFFCYDCIIKDCASQGSSTLCCPKCGKLFNRIFRYNKSMDIIDDTSVRDESFTILMQQINSDYEEDPLYDGEDDDDDDDDEDEDYDEDADSNEEEPYDLDQAVAINRTLLIDCFRIVNPIIYSKKEMTYSDVFIDSSSDDESYSSSNGKKRINKISIKFNKKIHVFDYDGKTKEETIYNDKKKLEKDYIEPFQVLPEGDSDDDDFIFHGDVDELYGSSDEESGDGDDYQYATGFTFNQLDAVFNRNYSVTRVQRFIEDEKQCFNPMYDETINNFHWCYHRSILLDNYISNKLPTSSASMYNDNKTHPLITDKDHSICNYSDNLFPKQVQIGQPKDFCWEDSHSFKKHGNNNNRKIKSTKNNNNVKQPQSTIPKQPSVTTSTKSAPIQRTFINPNDGNDNDNDDDDDDEDDDDDNSNDSSYSTEEQPPAVDENIGEYLNDMLDVPKCKQN